MDDDEYVKKVLGEYYDLLPKDEDIKWEIHVGAGVPVSILDCDFNIFLKTVKEKLLELEATDDS